MAMFTVIRYLNPTENYQVQPVQYLPRTTIDINKYNFINSYSDKICKSSIYHFRKKSFFFLVISSVIILFLILLLFQFLTFDQFLIIFHSVFCGQLFKKTGDFFQNDFFATGRQRKWEFRPEPRK